jgi:hypothetical protein
MYATESKAEKKEMIEINNKLSGIFSNLYTAYNT